MGDPILEVRNIRKNFNNEFLINDIDIDLREGEVHIIVGENGSGKSALMKIISGLYPRDAGSVRLFGEEVFFDSFHASRRAGIFYQHQDIQLFENLSVAENVYFDRMAREGRLWRLFHPGRYETQCRDLFDKLGVNISPAEKVRWLGYAQRQLLSAVKAYISERGS